MPFSGILEYVDDVMNIATNSLDYVHICTYVVDKDGLEDRKMATEIANNISSVDECKCCEDLDDYIVIGNFFSEEEYGLNDPLKALPYYRKAIDQATEYEAAVDTFTNFFEEIYASNNNNTLILKELWTKILEFNSASEVSFIEGVKEKINDDDFSKKFE